MKIFRYLIILATIAPATPYAINTDLAECHYAAANRAWSTLVLDDGQVVEIAVDFEIDKIEVQTNGDSKFTAKTKIENEEFGFIAELSEFEVTETALVEPNKFLKEATCTIAIKSLGTSTSALERRVLEVLGKQRPLMRFRFAGMYRAYWRSPVATINEPIVLEARAAGIMFDHTGAKVPETPDYFCDLKFIIDAPRKRLTVYFSERAGYGGVSGAEKARRQWLKSVTIGDTKTNFDSK